MYIYTVYRCTNIRYNIKKKRDQWNNNHKSGTTKALLLAFVSPQNLVFYLGRGSPLSLTGPSGPCTLEGLRAAPAISGAGDRPARARLPERKQECA